MINAYNNFFNKNGINNDFNQALFYFDVITTINDTYIVEKGFELFKKDLRIELNMQMVDYIMDTFYVSYYLTLKNNTREIIDQEK